jgi:hypothetical protein
MKRAELSALLSEVDHDGSGEVEYPEFLEIMTVTLQRLSEEEDSEKNEGQVGGWLGGWAAGRCGTEVWVNRSVQSNPTILCCKNPGRHLGGRLSERRTGGTGRGLCEDC